MPGSVHRVPQNQHHVGTSEGHALAPRCGPMRATCSPGRQRPRANSTLDLPLSDLGTQPSRCSSVEDCPEHPAPAMMVAMPERNLQIARFIGETASLAYCDVCRLVFRTRQEFLLDPAQARQQLQSDFDK